MTKVCVEFNEDNGPGTGEPPVGVRTYSQVVGDGSSTSYTVNHNFGNADVLYAVRNLATGEVDAYGVSGTSTENALNLTFDSPVPASQARVTVLSLAAQA